MPQFQGTATEDSYKGSWLDIYVDLQGPFTESEEGYRYICTYTCRLLRVPMLVPRKTLQKEEAMQAVGTAMLRTLTVPMIIRHDRGPEFGSAVLEEVCTLLGSWHGRDHSQRGEQTGGFDFDGAFQELSSGMGKKVRARLLRDDDQPLAGVWILPAGSESLLVYDLLVVSRECQSDCVFSGATAISTNM